MGNLCCAEDITSLSDRERRELEAIKKARGNANQMIEDRPESVKDLTASQIENNIYPAPEYIREKSPSIKEKHHDKDFKGKKFMNDPNPTPSPSCTPMERDIYGQIYPPPANISHPQKICT